MIYRGTRCIPLDSPEWSECRLRNRASYRVVILSSDAYRVAPFDLFINKAGQIVAQDIMGRRYPLSKLCPFHLETRTTTIAG